MQMDHVRMFISKQRYPLMLLAILASSSVFIFGGANWGLPLILHTDEWYHIDPAISFVHDRVLYGHYYHHSYFLVQLLAFVFRVCLFFFGYSPENINDIGIHNFHLIARILTGLFLVGSTIIAYFIGKKFSNSAAVLCAFLIAFYPRFITHSHYAVANIPSVFCIILFIYLALNYAEKPGFKNLTCLAVVTGVFITIKYPGAIMCAAIAISVIVHSLKDKKYIRILKHGVVSVVLVAATTVLIFPWSILRLEAVSASFLSEARSTHLGADGLSWFDNMVFYANNYLLASGIILLVFFVIGCFFIIKDKQVLLKSYPLFYGIIFWIGLSQLGLHWERWGLPMYVTPLLVSAIGISKSFYYIKSNSFFLRRIRLSYSIFTFLVIAIALNLVSGSAASLTGFLVPDTRGYAQNFDREQGIDRNNSIFEGYTSLQLNIPVMFFDEFDFIDGSFYIRSRPRYVLTSSFMFDRFRNERDIYILQNDIYDYIEDRMIEIKRFTGVQMNHSIVSLCNIYHNISYIKQVLDHGMDGPTLVYYQTDPGSFYPLSFPMVFDFSNDQVSPSYEFFSQVNSVADGSAFISNGDSGFLVFGPYSNLETLSASYTAVFKLRLVEHSNEDLGYIDISMIDGAVIVARFNLAPEMFTDAIEGDEFIVEFTLPEWANSIEYRVFVSEGTILQVISITIDIDQ